MSREVLVWRLETRVERGRLDLELLREHVDEVGLDETRVHSLEQILVIWGLVVGRDVDRETVGLDIVSYSGTSSHQSYG